MINLVNKYFKKKINAIGLAWFRVFYFLVLLNDVHELYINDNLIFDPLPYYWQSDISFKLLIFIWMVSISMIIMGLFTKFNTILNYIFTITLISTLSQFEYHIYYIYSGVNLLAMFIPLNKVFSLDNLIYKLKNSKLGNIAENSRTTTVWSYWLFPFMGIGMVYLGSVFYKLNDPIWLKGLGLWWPASFPVATNIPMPWLLDSEWLIKFLGYFALIFELVFIFIFWFKKLRLFVALVGIVFHIGIYLFFPIPNFAIAVACLYLLCIPIRFWNFSSKLKFKKPLITVYYDGECPLCFRTKIFIEHFDVFNAINFKVCQDYFESDFSGYSVSLNQLLDDLHGIDRAGKMLKGFKLYRQIMLKSIVFAPLGILCYLPGVSHLGHFVYRKIASSRETYRCNEDNCIINLSYQERQANPNDVNLLRGFSVGDFKVYLIVFFLCVVSSMQIVVIYFSPASGVLMHYVSKVPMAHEGLTAIRTKFIKPTVFLTGITGHDVFLRSHFANYHDAIKLTFVEQDLSESILPLVDNDGKPSGIVSGCVWANFTFRFMMPDVKKENFIFGLKRYTSNWLEGQDNGQPYVFKVYTKKMVVPEQWEPGIQARELNKHDWKYLGTVTWKNKEFHYEGEIIDNIGVAAGIEPKQ
jgi:predicted DCC family thiol-disulfide oxidoreductase YuxK